jgi:hypothetical protein
MPALPEHPSTCVASGPNWRGSCSTGCIEEACNQACWSKTVCLGSTESLLPTTFKGAAADSTRTQTMHKLNAEDALHCWLAVSACHMSQLT